MTTPKKERRSREDSGNYRAVSFALIPREILDPIVKQSIGNHLEEQKFVGSDQHGFVKSKLCQVNLISVYDRVTGHVDKGKVIDVIYPDFSNAFEPSPHDILISKRGDTV